MSWTDHALLAFDLETDSIDVFDARIVTASLVWSIPNEEPRVREWLLQPDRPIAEGATKIHGITTEHATEHGVDREAAIADMTGILGLAMHRQTPVVIMNAPYDTSVLHHECLRVGVDTLSDRGPLGPILDPLAIDRGLRKVRGFGGRKLEQLCDWYGVIHAGAHDASADCQASLDVLRAQAFGFPELKQRTVAELQPFQAKWHAEWSAGFARFLESKGKTDHDLTGEWPIRVTPPAAAAEAVA